MFCTPNLFGASQGPHFHGLEFHAFAFRGPSTLKPLLLVWLVSTCLYFRIHRPSQKPAHPLLCVPAVCRTNILTCSIFCLTYEFISLCCSNRLGAPERTETLLFYSTVWYRAKHAVSTQWILDECVNKSGLRPSHFLWLGKSCTPALVILYLKTLSLKYL